MATYDNVTYETAGRVARVTLNRPEKLNAISPQLPLGAGYVGSSWTWLVGPKKAKEMFFPTGEMISSTEAVQWGPLNRAVPADQLDAAVADYVARVARTPKEIIALQKLSANRIQEIQGFREAMLQSVELDAIAHASRPAKAINAYIREHGLQAALRAFHAVEIPLATCPRREPAGRDGRQTR